jgi:hypothetical protein
MEASMSRRAFLSTATLAVAACAVTRRPPSWGPGESTSPLVRRVVRSPSNSYYTYPHSNGFLPDGKCVLASTALAPGNPGLDFLSFDLGTGESSLITHLRDPRMYYAIDRKGVAAVARQHGVFVVDMLRKNDPPRPLFEDPKWTVHSDCDISADGTKVLITLARHDPPPMIHRCDLIDVASGQVETIMETTWTIDHAHFSPFDPSWIVMANAEPHTLARLWVWNRESAPNGRNLFEQARPDGKVFAIGHERAMFNKRAVLVVAYGSNSSARPCGLYEVGFDGMIRLVSESMRDLHCNVSGDGRWAVVSLQGTHDALMQRISGDWLEGPSGYGWSDVMVVNLATGARQFLYRGTNSNKGQPYEVQPTISPDAKWVLLKDGNEQCVLCVEIEQSKLEAFLA